MLRNLGKRDFTSRIYRSIINLPLHVILHFLIIVNVSLLMITLSIFNVVSIFTAFEQVRASTAKIDPTCKWRVDLEARIFPRKLWATIPELDLKLEPSNTAYILIFISSLDGSSNRCPYTHW